MLRPVAGLVTRGSSSIWRDVRGMGTIWRSTCAVVLTAVVATLLGTTGPASAAIAQDAIVSGTPSQNTPQVLDRRVLDMVEAGNRIVVVGEFTRVRDANSTAVWDQPYVFAF